MQLLPHKPHKNQETKAGSCTHFDVKEEAAMLKNVAWASDAIALARNVLPFPGGPKRSNPVKNSKNSKVIIGHKICKSFFIYPISKKI